MEAAITPETQSDHRLQSLPHVTRCRYASLPEALRAFFSVKERSLAPTSLAMYRSWLRRFNAYAGDGWPVAAATVNGFLGTLGARNIPSSVRAADRTLRVFFSWATNEGRDSPDPMEDVGRRPTPKTVPHCPEGHDIRRLLSVSKGHRYRARIEAGIALAAFYGLRVSELSALRWIDVEANRITLREAKGDKDRVVPHSRPEVKQALERWRKQQERGAHPNKAFAETDFVFTDGRVRTRAQQIKWFSGVFQRDLRDLSKRAGLVRPIRPHLLRHYMITQSLVHGVPLVVVQQAAGHSDVSSTMRYAHVKEADVQRAYDNIALSNWFK